MDDVNEPVVPFKIDQKHDLTKAHLKVEDRLGQGIVITVGAGSDTYFDGASHETWTSMRLGDWAEIEALRDHLDTIISHRNARVTALPTYEARFIDDPAFPTQRMSVTKWNNSLGGHDTLFIGTEAEVRERYEFFGNNTNRDIDNRPRYWARDKI